MELRHKALQALCTPDIQQKVALVTELHAQAAALPIAAQAPSADGMVVPGRPDRPELIHPARVPKRTPTKPEGLAALLHAIAHIEFNAINLALDAAWRFDGMPREFHLDWIRIAAEEAYHFNLVADHLATLGGHYGDFPAHDSLWLMCEKTAGDVTARMALVPRTLEARGLDATPQIQEKLRRVGTPAAKKAVDILDIILREEVGHVAVGNHWYRWLCERQGLEPLAHYRVLVQQYAAPRAYPPFNESARREAGFSDAEIDYLFADASAAAELTPP